MAYIAVIKVYDIQSQLLFDRYETIDIIIELSAYLSHLQISPNSQLNESLCEAEIRLWLEKSELVSNFNESYEGKILTKQMKISRKYSMKNLIKIA